MGKRYKAAGAVCPFYCSEDPSKIYCQGLLPGKQWTHLAFQDAKDKKAYEEKYCKGCWEKCRYAQIHQGGI